MVLRWCEGISQQSTVGTHSVLMKLLISRGVESGSAVAFEGGDSTFAWRLGRGFLQSSWGNGSLDFICLVEMKLGFPLTPQKRNTFCRVVAATSRILARVAKVIHDPGPLPRRAEAKGRGGGFDLISRSPRWPFLTPFLVGRAPLLK